MAREQSWNLLVVQHMRCHKLGGEGKNVVQLSNRPFQMPVDTLRTPRSMASSAACCEEQMGKCYHGRTVQRKARRLRCNGWKLYWG